MIYLETFEPNCMSPELLENNQLSSFPEFVDKIVNKSDIDFSAFNSILDLLNSFPNFENSFFSFKEYKSVIDFFLEHKKGNLTSFY